MRNMSFALTTEQIRNRTKTVTRRLGWKNLKPGDLVQACVKCMGLKPGEKIERLCVIRIIAVRQESLARMINAPTYGRKEAIREGFPDMTGREFVEMFCRGMKCYPEQPVTRIAFMYED